mmetsp:Transcript_42708/g.166868  ORF Transcript_42708/g.166868 Transcript_42708/m.166868 type:complete len:90 (-) Transcript_42708:941-1210(-)
MVYATDIGMMATRGKVRLGIIGAGRIGQVHCLALSRNPKAEVVIVADFFVKAAESCAQKFGIPSAVQVGLLVVAMSVWAFGPWLRTLSN